MTQNMFNQHAINCRALLIDKLVMNLGLSYVRLTTNYIKQYRFFQKEARVCERIASLNGVCCCGRWASERGSRYANVNIVVERNGMFAEGTVVWNDYVKKMMLWK